MPHIKLGIGNKVVSVFDGAIEEWATYINNMKKCREHSANCLSSVGASRKQYYYDATSGEQCENLLRHVSTLCQSLFHKSIE